MAFKFSDLTVPIINRPVGAFLSNDLDHDLSVCCESLLAQSFRETYR
jgi:hypothetical protein